MNDKNKKFLITDHAKARTEGTAKAVLMEKANDETYDILEESTLAYEIEGTRGLFYAMHKAPDGSDVKRLAYLWSRTSEALTLVAVDDEEAQKLLLDREAYEELEHCKRLDDKYAAIEKLQDQDAKFDEAVEDLKRRNVEEWEGDATCLQDDLFELYDRWGQQGHLKNLHA